jgi:hypothetical protein
MQQHMVDTVEVWQAACLIYSRVSELFLQEQAQQQQQDLQLHQASGSEAAAAAAGDEETDALSAGLAQGQQSSSSSSSSSQAVRWQYLLRLHESRKLANAAATCQQQWSLGRVAAVLESIHTQLQALEKDKPKDQPYTTAVSSSNMADLRQLYHDSQGFCRTLVAVAPLPVVCKNPGCVELLGVSEAAAARYVCAGCGCRYCSAACQAAGWRSHKKACGRMAACQMRVEG